MDIRICGIFKLLGHKSLISQPGQKTFGFLYRTTNAFLRRCQYQLCSETLNDLLSFLTHIFRHYNDHTVAFSDTDKSKTYAGVAGGWLDDRHAWL